MYFILDISGEFKVMHFTSSNLLHDFLNGKYMFFYNAQKISRLDVSGFNDLEGLKKENKKSKETRVDRLKPLR